jgi:hypothetical protein
MQLAKAILFRANYATTIYEKDSKTELIKPIL